MKVCMFPQLAQFGKSESGIRRVVEAYHKYLPEHGIKFVKDVDGSDLVVIHAGCANTFPDGIPIVSAVHGLYWTGDYDGTSWEYRANTDVINSIRMAREITVPSEWVAETFYRDMHYRPHIVWHGIEHEEWLHKEQIGNYALWTKNRIGDVCDPRPVSILAEQFPNMRFMTTFAEKDAPPNVRAMGAISNKQMRLMIQRAAVYISTTKETFGIGTLEALAAGTPVIGFDEGGNKIMVKHGVNGYLAKPGNFADLTAGFSYCLQHRKVLSENALETIKQFSWGKPIEQIAGIFRLASSPYEPPHVSIVIPSYRYAEKVGRAIESAINQEGDFVKHIVVVDDGSDDNGETKAIVDKFHELDPRVEYVYQVNAGVAIARNHGISLYHTKYVCCLDADDWIAPTFIRICVTELESSPQIGIAYTGITAHTPDGKETVSQWPEEYDFDRQIKRRNQVPTCCVFRKKMWDRTGGYRQRYAPKGAGSEDAEFWLSAGGLGFAGKKVSGEGLFHYSLFTGQVSGNRKYSEVDWLYFHPWTADGVHPFLSVASTDKASHTVFQRDSPEISVIVPVGPGHKGIVFNVLDSLEAQTFREWEVILVDDTGDDEPYTMGYGNFESAYPFVRHIKTEGKKGAGFARNAGAKVARGKMLLFIDADDSLYREALELMMGIYKAEGAIVYSDHVSKSIIPPEEIKKMGNRVLAYDEKTNMAIVRYFAPDFDCSIAVKQPDRTMYIWCLISALVPKLWHDEIGGFDELMPSWEDWDYWIRMARADKCFTRIPEPLMVYCLYSGTRRDRGLHEAENLIQYLKEKYALLDKEDKPMCSSCGKKKSPSYQKAMSAARNPGSRSEMAKTSIEDSEVILVEYNSLNRGKHPIVGARSHRQYNNHRGGDKFLMLKEDQEAQPGLFIPVIVTEKEKVSETPIVLPPSPSPVVSIHNQSRPMIDTPPISPNMPSLAASVKPAKEKDPAAETELTKVTGISASMAISMNAEGLYTPQDVANTTTETLLTIKGIGAARAKAIILSAQEYVKKN